ncbi:MAG: ABC transporter ATP-binding protein [Nitrospirae bacterium]|nr:ABC transporter ATP-binding protein [Nitrospirota bacterium]MCL5976992.1 ABC transporter ATP-binding protein [Nitrospirota bacterium]
MALLEIKNLNAGYGDLRVLRDVSMEVNEGEIVAFLGSNGAGKSTFMRTIVGLNRAWSGDVIMNGKRLTNSPSEKIIKSGIGIVPEGRRLFAGMTVTENLEMGAYCNRKDIRRRMDSIFQSFPRLYERKDHLAGDLSGGEQQMCAIGRALMSEPKILLIDEFSLGLAPTVVDSLTKVVQDINRQGVSILIVEQDVQMVLEMSSRAYVMEVGAITISGNSKDLIDNPKIKEAYLGM